jgi:hypothetical protein
MEIRPCSFPLPVFETELPKNEEKPKIDIYDIDFVVERGSTDSCKPKPLDTGYETGTCYCTHGCDETEVCSDTDQCADRL